jgi:hypothetical protein
MRKVFSLASTAALAGAALSGLAFMPSAGAGVADTLNCSDFEFQEDAQAVFDQDPSDPHRLDQGGVPGLACEDRPNRPAGETPPPTTQPPTTAPPGSFAPVAPAQPAPSTPGSPRFTG